VLTLSYNQLSGPLPALDGLPIGHFSAVGNQLSGTIPPLAGATDLTEYSVSDNRLTGALPALADAAKLDSFRAAGNRLTGSVPPVGTALRRLRIEDNRLSGSVPEPPPGSILVADGSTLCPNPLAATPSAAWDAATGTTPWHRDCNDRLFVDGFEP